MKRSGAGSGLACLDGGFHAVYRGDEVENLFPGGVDSGVKQGILVDRGLVEALSGCACELNRGECDVRIEAGDGGYMAYCNERGTPWSIPANALRRYAFDWPSWARELRRANTLAGPEPRIGKGCLFIGSGSAYGHRFHLVAVAPGARRSGDILLPPDAMAGESTPVLMLLGAGGTGRFEHPTVEVTDVLAADLVTLDLDALEPLLAATPVVLTDGELAHRVYTQDDRRGRLVGDAEVGRLEARRTRDTFDLFIDLVGNKVWRKGRAVGMARDRSGASTGKVLGPVAVRLLADYVKRPGHPMAARDTPTYRDRNAAAKSATNQLDVVRRSIAAGEHLKWASGDTEPGAGRYVFEPLNWTYCVVERVQGDARRVPRRR